MEQINNNFEEQMKRLEEIVSELEKGELNLDESVSKFEEGMKIAKQCREKGVNHIVYIQSSPCMSEPFIKRLWYAQQYYKEMYGEQLGLTYVTKLTIVKNPEKHPELFV